MMDEYQLFYNIRGNITFVVQSSKDLPTKIVQYVLDEIANNFLRLYADVLPSWKGNVEVFADFKEYLKAYLGEDLIAKVLEVFGYRFNAEGIILYDETQDKIIFSQLPGKFASQRHKSMGGIITNFAKNISNMFEAGLVNSVLLSTENKWICVAKSGKIYITVLFPKTEEIEPGLIIRKTEETLNEILKMIET